MKKTYCDICGCEQSSYREPVAEGANGETIVLSLRPQYAGVGISADVCLDCLKRMVANA